MKKKTEGQKWNEFTYGAWWIPFPQREGVAAKRAYGTKAGRSDMMKYCPNCDKVYEVNQFSKPRQIFYFSNVPKRQTAKTCQVCRGKKCKQINY